jgi:lipoprotein-anchoring transpeptidase ErfK/SrfK
MSLCRFAVMVLIGVGPGGHLLAQQYTQPVPAEFSGVDTRGEQQPVLRPPTAVGVDDSDLTGTVDPRSLTAMPPEVRPEIGASKELPAQFRRALVDYRTSEPVGTIVVDTANTYLYLVAENGKAMRYGIGVGREGFTWAGSNESRRLRSGQIGIPLPR